MSTPEISHEKRFPHLNLLHYIRAWFMYCLGHFLVAIPIICLLMIIYNGGIGYFQDDKVHQFPLVLFGHILRLGLYILPCFILYAVYHQLVSLRLRHKVEGYHILINVLAFMAIIALSSFWTSGPFGVDFLEAIVITELSLVLGYLGMSLDKGSFDITK